MGSPIILNYSLLPCKVIAKAWTDSDYLTDLLANPNDVIQDAIHQVPLSYNFFITQNTTTDKYFPLPYFDPQFTEWSQEEVLKKLIIETCGDISMEYFLPAWVINKAFFDGTYKASLLNLFSPGGANIALAAAGYTVPGGLTYYALSNTATDHNLALPLQPLDWMGLDYNAILKRLYFYFSQLT